MRQKNIFAINPTNKSKKNQKQFFYSQQSNSQNFYNQPKITEQEFDALWNNPAIGIRVFNSNGETLKANNKLLELLGYNDEEFLKKEDKELVLSVQQEEVQKKLQKFLKDSSKIENLEKSLLTSDAGVISFEAFWIKIENEQNELQYILEILLLKQNDLLNETIIRYQKDFLRTLINSIPNAVFYKNTDGLFLGCNKKFESLFDVKIDEIFGKSVYDVLPKVLADHEVNTDKKILSSKQDLFYESQLSVPPNEMRKVKVNKSIFFNENGEIAGIISVMDSNPSANTPIVNDVKLENDNTNSNKDRIFSILSHDLRSPFTTLMGFSDLLVDEYDNFSDDEKKSYLQELQKSAKNAYENLNDLILWTKSQVDSINLKTEMVDLTFLVDEIINELSIYAKSKDIILENRIPEHINVFVDKSILSKIISEVLDNSVKFSFSRSRIIINAKYTKTEVELLIQDHGVGMNKQELQRLFLPDEQIIKYGTNKERGSGLGLILCKELISKIKGEIFIESEKDVGTTTRIIFPKSII